MKVSSAVQHASHTVPEELDVEIEEETYSVTSELEVGEELGAVNRGERFYRLDLHDHGRFDYEIDPDAAVELGAFIPDRNLLRGLPETPITPFPSCPSYPLCLRGESSPKAASCLDADPTGSLRSEAESRGPIHPPDLPERIADLPERRAGANGVDHGRHEGR